MIHSSCDERGAMDPGGADALMQEWYNGQQALVEHGVDGAERFPGGLGGHGEFGKIY